MAKKNKTNKAIRKRIKLTGKGKVRYNKPGKSHLLSNKSGSRRRKLRRKETMRAVDAKKILSHMR